MKHLVDWFDWHVLLETVLYEYFFSQSAVFHMTVYDSPLTPAALIQSELNNFIIYKTLRKQKEVKIA